MSSSSPLACPNERHATRETTWARCDLETGALHQNADASGGRDSGCEWCSGCDEWCVAPDARLRSGHRPHEVAQVPPTGPVGAMDGSSSMLGAMCSVAHGQVLRAAREAAR